MVRDCVTMTERALRRSRTFNKYRRGGFSNPPFFDDEVNTASDLIQNRKRILSGWPPANLAVFPYKPLNAGGEAASCSDTCLPAPGF